MQKLDAMGHDPTNRLEAMRLAADYGQALYTGVFYQASEMTPTFESGVAERQRSSAPARSRADVLQGFIPR
jgi:hypothetical protein